MVNVVNPPSWVFIAPIQICWQYAVAESSEVQSPVLGLRRAGVT
jgi:hypothetical protein